MRRLVKAASLLILAGTLTTALWVHSRSRLSLDVPYISASVGDVVCRPDGKMWAPQGSTALIIVMSPTCPACNLSKDFSDELYEYGRANGMPAYYVFPQDRSSDSGAADLRVAGRIVFRTALREFGIRQLPTFLRVDHDGVIQSMWTGSIPASSHDAVLKSLISGSSLDAYQRIPESELASYRQRPKVQILALSEIGQQPGTTIIPANEISIRAKYELDPNLVTLVDCGTTLIPAHCQTAAMELTKLHFKYVIAVGLPTRPRCTGK